MTLHVMRDLKNLYLAFDWTHEWILNPDDPGSSPDQYLLVLAFDINHNGLWEDEDRVLYSIDDMVALSYLGVDIGDPQPPEDAWIKIYIPHGLYIYSWGDADYVPGGEYKPQIDVIGGPPAIPGTIWTGVPGPGPLDRSGRSVTFRYGVGRSPSGAVSGQTYEYTLEVAVPMILFPGRSAGFGLGLQQETNANLYLWAWPNEVDPDSFDVADATSAGLLGTLNLWFPGKGSWKPFP